MEASRLEPGESWGEGQRPKDSKSWLLNLFATEHFIP